MMLKIVNSNKEAIQNIENRLKDDVGVLFELVFEKWQSKKITPNWAFARMLFPISESLGGLKYNKSGTAENQYKVLQYDYSKINIQYSEISAIIAQLFRHSLIHQDEMRHLRIKRSFVTWELKITNGSDKKHLNIRKVSRAKWCVTFNLYQFYLDTLQVCKLLKSEANSHKVKYKKNYNSWTEKLLVSNMASDNTAIKEFEKIKNQIRNTNSISSPQKSF